MNNHLIPLDGGRSALGEHVSQVYDGILRDYTQLKYMFDLFRQQLALASPKRYPWSHQKDAAFPDILATMVSMGVNLNPERIKELYARYTGAPPTPLSIDRKRALEDFATFNEIFAKASDISTEAQWQALHETAEWFESVSMETRLKQVESRQFGLRYSILGRVIYHLLRRELSRKPVGQDLRDAIVASEKCEGMQNEVHKWMNTMVP